MDSSGFAPEASPLPRERSTRLNYEPLYYQIVSDRLRLTAEWTHRDLNSGLPSCKDGALPLSYEPSSTACLSANAVPRTCTEIMLALQASGFLVILGRLVFFPYRHESMILLPRYSQTFIEVFASSCSVLPPMPVRLDWA